jgi:hypothetical protein
MRRRTNAGLTALQAALAGIGGGFAGYAKDKEIRKEDEERERIRKEREAETAYRREMDAASLMERGFMTPEGLGERRQAAGGDMARHTMDSVRSMLNPAAAPPPDPSRMERVLDAGGVFRQGQEMSLGGRRMVLPESVPQRQERLAARARGDERGERQAALVQRQREREEEQRIRAQERAEDAKLQERLTNLRNQPAPERPYSPERDIEQATIKYSTTPQGEMFGLPGALPTEQQVREYRANLRRAMGLDGAPTQAAAAALAPPPAQGDTQQASLEARARAWKADPKNKRRDGESNADYAARMRQAILGGG